MRLISILLISIVAFACREAPPRAAGAASAAVVDDFGATIDVGRVPTRIVSLNPTTTEILFAVGAGSRLVGRTTYDIFPDSAKAVPDLGPGIRPNVEAILGARPDLVILYASSDNKPAADRLRAAGIAVVGFKIDSIEQFRRVTRLLGRLTGDSARAAHLVDTVSATIERVRAATAPLPRPTAFIHAWDKPVIAIAGGSFMSELLEIAGARNVYANVPLPSVTVTLEDVVARDPQFVLATRDEIARIGASPAWRALRAVREGRMMAYDADVVARPSVRLGMAARQFADLLHPGAVR